MMKLIKTDEIITKPDIPQGEVQSGKMMTLNGEIECHVWTDLNGNPCAWTPVDSGVISIEIGDDEDVALEVYRELKKERTEKTAEERIAELEEMVAKLATKLV